MKKLLSICMLSLVSAFTAHAVEPGAKAPGFHLTDLQGRAVSLAAFKGKVVVLEWVNFGCPFVMKHYASGNMPALQQEAAELGVVWIAVNSSAEGKQGYLPSDQMAELAKKQGCKATHFVMDTDGVVGRSYGAKVTPHMFIINADGKVAYNGAIDSKPTVEQGDVKTAEPWFKNAMLAVVAGNATEQATTKPYGCGVKYAK